MQSIVRNTKTAMTRGGAKRARHDTKTAMTREGAKRDNVTGEVAGYVGLDRLATSCRARSLASVQCGVPLELSVQSGMLNATVILAGCRC